MNTLNCPSYEVVDVNIVDNEIGGFTTTDTTITVVNGYLDLLNGSEGTTQNAFTQDSTHILITDYREDIERGFYIIDSENNRYRITLVDDPVKLHNHLEIYLKLIEEA